MNDNINDILATKRAWRNAEKTRTDRRIKKGTIDERKDLSIAIKEGRKQLRKRNPWREILDNIYKMLGLQ